MSGHFAKWFKIKTNNHTASLPPFNVDYQESGKHSELLQFVSTLLRGRGEGYNEGKYYQMSGKRFIEAIFVLILKSVPRHFVQDCRL